MNFQQQCEEKASRIQLDLTGGTCGDQLLDTRSPSPNTNIPSSTTSPEIKKPCVICGDRGNGYHYGAYACEGCKAFFKRYLAKKSKYACKKQDDCEITKKTRNQCPACRLKKCISSGMYKEDSAQTSRPNNNDHQTSHNPELTQFKTETFSQSSPDTPTPDYINDLINSAVNADPFKTPHMTINPQIITAIMKQTTPPGSVSFSDSPISPYSSSPDADISILPGYPSGFSPECTFPAMGPPTIAAGGSPILDMAHLTASMAAEIMPGMDPSLLMEGEDPSPMFVFLQAYAELFEIVAWARKLEGFQILGTAEKIKLLRNSFMSLSILRLTIRTVGCPPGFICMSKGVNMPTSVMAKMGFKPILMSLTAQSAKIFGQAEPDDTEYSLLNVIMLFTPDNDDDGFSDSIYELRDKYLNALNCYMLKRTPDTALHRFSLLLMELPNIKTASFISQDMFMNMVKNGQAHMNQLVTELFHCKFGEMKLH